MHPRGVLAAFEQGLYVAGGIVFVLLLGWLFANLLYVDVTHVCP